MKMSAKTVSDDPVGYPWEHSDTACGPDGIGNYIRYLDHPWLIQRDSTPEHLVRRSVYLQAIAGIY